MSGYQNPNGVTETHNFYDGMWYFQKDVKVDWATEIVDLSADSKSLRALATSKRIVGRGDTLNAPTLTISLTAPLDGVIGVTSTHWKSRSTRNGTLEPRFKLFPDSDGLPPATHSPSIKTNAAGSITAGDLKAEFSTASTTTSGWRLGAQGSFGLSFQDVTSKAQVSRLGWRGLGYITDSRDRTKKDKKYSTTQLELQVGEKIFGFGERFGPLVKNGQRVELWHKDCGTSTSGAYKNIPFYLSSKNYGVFVDSTNHVCYEVQSERTTRVNIVVPGEEIRYYIIHGGDAGLKGILDKYTLLTGRPALPPDWSFGLWLSTSFTTSYDQATVSSFLDGMVERKIPLRVFHFDCFWMKGFRWCDFTFDPAMFPNPKQYLHEIKQKYGVKICVWINPYIAQESSIFDEGDEAGYFLKRGDGSSWQWDMWQAGMGLVDFTNPDAYKWYASKLAHLISLGVDSFKTDFGERIPVDDVFYHDGTDAKGMHNMYTHLYNQCTFETLVEAKGVGEAAVFARSATAGGQRFPVHWGGDCMSTFEAMAESLRGGLSLGLSGFGFWSHDIGGFEGNPDPTVYKRWCQFGLLSSHSRLHGSDSYRVPWNFDDESSVVLAKFSRIKNRLMPYIFHHSIIAHQAGTPVLRPTFLEFPKDHSTWNLETQYLLGDSLLVAPIFTASGSVLYYVPAGKWIGLLDGKARVGPAWIEEEHSCLTLPLLTRPGSAIVIGGEDDTPDYEWEKGFSVLVTPLDKSISKSVWKTKIPDSKKKGLYTHEVTVVQEGAKLSVNLSGKPKGKWNVCVVGSDSGDAAANIGPEYFSTAFNRVIGSDKTEIVINL